MLSIYSLKPKFQAILRPLTNFLSAHNITPNMITILAIVCSIAMGLAIFLYSSNPRILYGVPILLLVRMILNAIDGMLAREHNMQTKLGAILNELGDIVSDVVLYLPFTFVAGFEPWLVIIIVILAIITETTGILGCQIGASRRYDGPCGKSDRAFIFSVLALLLALGVDIYSYMLAIQAIIIMLLIFTIFNRAKHALGEANV